MRALLKEIICLPECLCIKVLAGEAGLKKEIKWTCSLEAIENERFVNEGDLVFVTGIATQDDEQLLLMTRLIYERNTAGIVFAIGPYIKRIPNSIIEFGNANQFPILSIPWESKISSITHSIGSHLLSDNINYPLITDILRPIILLNDKVEVSQDVKEKLEAQSFPIGSPFRVILFSVKPIDNENIDSNEHEQMLISRLYKDISSRIWKSYPLDVWPVQMQNSIAFVLTNDSIKLSEDEKTLNSLILIEEELQTIYKTMSIKFGIGKIYSKLEDISRSYQEALWVIKLSPKKQRSFQYDELGLYKIIVENSNKQSMIDFYGKSLEALEISDKINKNDLIRFLLIYLECNGNVTETSSHLFLHKNSVLYKIKKIENILNCDLSNLDDLMNIKAALMIREVLVKK
jgi:hypothetical protein